MNQCDKKVYDDICQSVQITCPQFKPDKQFVLWLVQELYIPYEHSKLEVNVKLFDENDCELSWNDFTKSKCVVRKPYINKHIHMISGHHQRRRTIGIFFIADTFEELQQIKRICVQWRCYIPEYDDVDDTIIQHCMYVYQVDYHVTFEHSSIPCWYVLFCNYTMDAISEIAASELMHSHDICVRQDTDFIGCGNCPSLSFEYVSTREGIARDVDNQLHMDTFIDRVIDMGFDMSHSCERQVIDYGVNDLKLSAESSDMLVKSYFHNPHRHFLHFLS